MLERPFRWKIVLISYDFAIVAASQTLTVWQNSPFFPGCLGKIHKTNIILDSGIILDNHVHLNSS